MSLNEKPVSKKVLSPRGTLLTLLPKDIVRRLAATSCELRQYTPQSRLQPVERFDTCIFTVCSTDASARKGTRCVWKVSRGRLLYGCIAVEQ